MATPPSKDVTVLPIAGGKTDADKPPAAVCTIATKPALDDLRLWLFSLAIWNADLLNAGKLQVFILADSHVCNELRGFTTATHPWLHVLNGLDMYSAYNRQQMASMPATEPILAKASRPLWDQFQLEKATVMKVALDAGCPNVLFTDSDILHLAPLRRIPVNSYDAILAPHYIREGDCAKWGYFNGGWLWISKADVLTTWRHATCVSRFHEQAALEQLTLVHKCTVLPMTEDFGWWRLFQGVAPPTELLSHFAAIDGYVCFQMNPITSVHTHLIHSTDMATTQFNQVIMKYIGEATATNPRMAALAGFIDRLQGLQKR